MRGGTPLRYGFKSHDRVVVTSRRLCMNRMPGVVTGDAPGHIRVRVTVPTTTMTASVWCKKGEVKKATSRG